MEWFALFIPAVIAIAALLYDRKRVVWWETLIVFAPAALVVLLTRTIIVSSATSDTEYYGSYTTKVQYFEPWDERHHKTCHNPEICTGSGKSRHCTPGSSYDCSYTEHHSAEWRKVDNNGNSFSISEDEYNRLVAFFATPKVFTDMHRNYYTYDGDQYSYDFPNVEAKVDPLTTEDSYVNKVRVSHSIFKLRDVTPKEKATYGLYDYPEIESNYQPSVLLPRGYDYDYRTETFPWDALNSLYGASKQIRIFVPVFQDKTIDAAEMQRNLWEGGNKNELIICIGVDAQKRVTWCKPFSWSDNPMVEIQIRDAVNYMKGQRLDLAAVQSATRAAINENWKRKEFKDFDYIQVELTTAQLLWLYIITGLVSIGLAVFVVMNNITEDSVTNSGQKSYNTYNRFK
jgi:hypothetical protein